ncbi:MAG: hypothetical protein ACPGJV_08845 [Bacteriovoracaceae bacterium]
MKNIITALLFLTSLSLQADPGSELNYKRFAVCKSTGAEQLKAYVYFTQNVKNQGLIVIEDKDKKYYSSSTKINSTEDQHGLRIHSNYFKMNYNQYDEDTDYVDVLFKGKAVTLGCLYDAN